MWGKKGLVNDNWPTRIHVSCISCFCLRPENRGSVLAFFSSPVRSATEWTATQHVGWWGGVGCNDILELAHMVDATVNLLTWLMLRNMMGWGGWGMMLTFLELAYMVDATQHDGVGWVGNDVNVPRTCLHGWSYATWWGGLGGEWC